MKLLLISVKSDVARGGIAVWTERFLTRCSQLNIDCSLVNTELIGKRVCNGKRRLWDELLRTHRIFRELKHLLKTQSFDAAYLNTSCGNFGLFRDYQLGKIISGKRIPLVTQYHCEIPYWIRRTASQRCLGRLVRLSRENLVLCQNSKNFLQAHYGVDAVKIPNFVEKTIVLSENKEISPQVERICFVGRVSEAKGANELFQIAKALPDIYFDLIGSISSAVAAWEKPENVELSGDISNAQVIKRLDKADLFLFPSHTEGCSMALMEAMARGVPAIATDTGANADMLAGGCGIVVNKQDVSGMIAAIRELDDPKRRKEMSCLTVKKAKENYTEKNVDKILSIVEQLQHQ